MECTGEMITYLPVVGAHLQLSGRFVDPALSAAMSWNYWYCWALIAAAVLVPYWTDAVPGGIVIAAALLASLGVNLCGPRVYAEIEFYMLAIKVLTIVGLAFLAVGSGSAEISKFLMNLTALAGIITWLCIAVSYLRFRAGMRTQGISRSALPCRSRFATPGAYWIILVVISASFVVIFVGFKVGGKTRFVKASEMDLTSGLDEIERRAAEENEKDALSSEFKHGSRIRGFLKRIVA
ncbi:hypothetical protein LQW54_004664 [Pestalotiopsis sp. IQ-011]